MPITAVFMTKDKNRLSLKIFMISKKELEILISKVNTFEKPKPELEQYQTQSGLASEMLWTAFMDGNIKERSVADFGCGTGIFAIGASLLGAKRVVGYDVDNNALVIARSNIKIVKKEGGEVGKITFQKGDISEVKKLYDTVIMNPPFGVQKKHADREFIEKAFAIAKKAIYSIHAAGPQTDKFIESFAGMRGFLASKIGDRELQLKATMEFHEKAKYPVNVALWKFLAL
jgi:putative methylase